MTTKISIALAGKIVIIYAIIASTFFFHLRKNEVIREFLASSISDSSMQEILEYLQEKGGNVRRISRDSSVISFPFPNQGMTVTITMQDQVIRSSIFLPDSEDEIIPEMPKDDNDDGIDLFRILFTSMIYTAPFILTSTYYIYFANKKKPLTFIRMVLIDIVFCVIIIVLFRKLGIM